MTYTEAIAIRTTNLNGGWVSPLELQEAIAVIAQNPGLLSRGQFYRKRDRLGGLKPKEVKTKAQRCKEARERKKQREAMGLTP